MHLGSSSFARQWALATVAVLVACLVLTQGQKASAAVSKIQHVPRHLLNKRSSNAFRDEASTDAENTGPTGSFPSGPAIDSQAAAVAEGTAGSGEELVDPTAWIVEFQSAPTIDGGRMPAIQREQAAFRAYLQAKMIKHNLRAEFNTLLNALSLDFESARVVDLLNEAPYVRAVWPMLMVQPPRVLYAQNDDIVPRINSASNMTGVFTTRSKLGYSGKNIRVGVIDSGIDYGHPALGGCFGAKCKVAFGYDFVGDDYRVGVAPPQPDADPMDCGGHGTHVAGIIAGHDDLLTGVAPEVTLGAYRVFGCAGATASDIIVMAMEKAYVDGMDVINLSLGGGSSWAGYPTAAAGDRLSRAGMVVVAAMGNDGQFGLWEASAPAVGRDVIAVASFDNSVYRGRKATLVTDGKDSEAVTVDLTYPDGQPPEADNRFILESLTHIGAADFAELCSLPRALQTMHSPIFANMTLLVRRGTCVFTEKLQNAAKLGAAAVVFYNNGPGALKVSLPANTSPLPYYSLTAEDGALAEKLIASGTHVEMTIAAEDALLANPASGRISSFSSWGPGPDLDVKPDIGAPGGLIFSTYPRKKGSYATLSGTSMATPHVAGCAALYLQAHGGRSKVSPQDLRRALQNTAIPAPLPFTQYTIDSVARQGAGLIQIDRAILRTTAIEPSKIALKEDPLVGPVKTGRFVVTNTGKSPLEYRVDHLPAVSVSAFDPARPEWANYSVAARIVPSTFSLAPGASKTVFAFFNPSLTLDNADRWIYSGFVRITPSATVPGARRWFGLVAGASKLVAQPPIHVPYAGFKGRYQSMQILPNIPSLPYMVSQKADVKGAARRSAARGGTLALNFTTVTTLDSYNRTIKVPVDQPRIVYALQHPTPMIEIFLRDAATNRILGKVDELKWNGRSQQSGSSPVAFVYSWDGCVQETAYNFNWRGVRVGVNLPGTGLSGGGVTVGGRLKRFRWGFKMGSARRNAAASQPAGADEESGSGERAEPDVRRIPVPRGQYRLYMRFRKAPGAWWTHIVRQSEEWRSPLIEVQVPVV